VAGRVLGPVGLRLDHDAGREAFGLLVDEDTAEEVNRDLSGVAVVEISP
jgi:hypothetical protein